MSDETNAQARIEQPLDDVLAHYIAGEEAGTAPNRQELLAQYPQLAGELREFFANRDQMQRLAEPLRGGADVGRGGNQPLGKVRYFGDYELLEEVAAGGMGIVYKARQRSLSRIVAVKMILKGTLAREDDVKRFRAEAEAAANLQHPAIVAIHEVGLHEGQHYFSMDFVDGHSLAELPREKPLSAHQAAEYIRDAAEAVHYAHQQGILHRDLKPSNILIDRQGRVRITDFGLAKRIEGNSDLTLTGQILGTPSYMPPEQATSKRSLVGVASDIYSLGAVLYELLTGRPPFRGESPAETLRQVESLDPVSPRLLNPATPRDLETICLKCLEKEPHKRYGTAQLLADDLGRYLRGEPIVARPIRAWQRGVKWVRRHPTVAGLIVMSIVALLAVVDLLIGQSYNARLQGLNHQLASAKASLETRNEQLSTAKVGLETSNRELGEASSKLEMALGDVTAERARARRYLYAARMALVQRAEQEKQPGRVVQLLRSVIPETPDEDDLREFEWHHLWRKYQGEERRFHGHTAPVTAVAFSPDNRWIASGSADGTIRIWDTQSDTDSQLLAGHGETVSGVAISLDGQLLISEGVNQLLKLWDLKVGNEIRSVPPGTLVAGSEAHREFWQPFGNELKTTNVPLAGETPRVKTATCEAFSADGNRRVEGKTVYSSTSVQATVTVQDLKLNQPLGSLSISAVVTQVAFSPDGAMVAVSALDQTVRILDALSGKVLCSLYASDGVRAIAFSPDGRRVVAGTEDRLVMLWQLPSGAIPGKEAQVLYQHTDPRGRANCVSFGAMGRFLGAVCDGQARVWDTASGKEIRTFSAHSYRRLALSPTNSWIVGATLDQLTDIRTGRAVLKLHHVPRGRDGGPFGYAISRDESLIAEATGGTSVVVQETETGHTLQTFAIRKWATCVAISPDNNLLAAGSGFYAQGADSRGSLLVHEINTGRLVFAVERLPLDVWGVAFSPDGRFLAAAMGVFEGMASDFNRIRVWDTSNWQTIYDLRGHTGCIWCVDFSPSGKRLASAGGQQYRIIGGKVMSPPGELKIWDMSTGEEVLTIVAESGPFYGVAFAPDGSHLASAGGGATVKLWDGTPLTVSPTYEALVDN